MNWHEIDRFLMGEAWSGSLIKKHLTELADVIGPRWGGSDGDRSAAEYIREKMEAAGLDRAEIEPFTIDTWNHGDVSITLPGDPGRVIASLPFTQQARSCIRRNNAFARSPFFDLPEFR